MSKSDKSRRVSRQNEPDQGQDVLHQDVQFAEKLLNTAHAIVLVLDLDGKILRFNSYTEHLTGHTLEEVQGKSWFETFLPQHDRERIREIFSQAISGVRTHGNINPIVTKDGNERVIEWFDAPLTDEKSRLVGVLCIGQDITEKRQIEKAKDQQQERLRAILNTTVDAIITINKQGIVDSFNPAAEKLFGYQASEVVGQNVKLLMPQPYHSEHDGYIARYLKTGEKKIIGIGREVVARRKDGSVFPIDLAISEVDHLGFFVGILRDITDRKIAEKQLLDQQNMLRELAMELSLSEERERRLIAAELHDRVGQTLAAAKIKLGVLRQTEGNAKFANELGHIHEIINQTIQATRSLTFELVSPVLHELGLEAALESLVNNAATTHGLRCRFEDDGQSKPLNEATRVTLYKAVRELLINIVKHAGAESFSVSVGRDRQSIRIQVEDDGVGFDMPEEGFHMSKKGGFGLFNIGDRLSYLSGTFEFESQPGHGTRVTLIAPLDIESPNKHGEGI